MTEIPTNITVSKIPIGEFVITFVIYLALHIVIAVLLKKHTEDLGNLKDTESEEYKSIALSVKILNILHKWFPAIALVVIILRFYI